MKARIWKMFELPPGLKNLALIYSSAKSFLAFKSDFSVKSVWSNFHLIGSKKRIQNDKTVKIGEQHSTMISILASGPSCPGFDSQHSPKILRRQNCRCCLGKSSALLRVKWLKNVFCSASLRPSLCEICEIPCLSTRWVRSLKTVHKLSSNERNIMATEISQREKKSEPCFKPRAAG